MPSLRQRLNKTGIGYAGLDGVWWRPATTPFSLPATLRAELVECGRALFALFDGVTELYRAGQSERLQHLLTYKVPGSLQQLVGSGRVLAVRPDFQLCLTAEGHYRPVATELEICPSAQGFAHAMQVAYGLAPDLARETVRLLAGRPLLVVGARSWSPFLFEQLAFCRALEAHGGEGRVLYDRPLALLDEEVRAERRWRPPLFGVPVRPPGWQSELLSRLRAADLQRYWWPDDSRWPDDVGEAVIFRFGYLNLFDREALDHFAAWQASRATWLNPPAFFLDSKTLLAATRLPIVRETVRARLGASGLQALDRCLPETVLLAPEQCEQLTAEQPEWVVKLAGFDDGELAWGGHSLTVGAECSAVEWRRVLTQYAALPWPVVAQRAVPSTRIDIAFLDEHDQPRRLPNGRTRLRVFLLRQEDDQVAVCGAHVTVSDGSSGVAEGLEAVQAPVVFT
ncbi:MAG: hypothetical protein R3300_01420 [Candidatus Promineifilaceae bacterium]|nr:hypothetical protein [Candidatus Promineifilaceae bacterium]